VEAFLIEGGTVQIRHGSVAPSLRVKPFASTVFNWQLQICFRMATPHTFISKGHIDIDAKKKKQATA